MLDTGFARPTLAELIVATRADLLARLGADEVLRRSDIDVQARVQAAALHSVYAFIDHLARQLLPDTATTAWLDRQAGWWGIARKAATAASGTATFATTAGAVIPAGAVLQHADGREYRTTAEAVAAGAATEVAVAAGEAGAAGNLAAGSVLSLVSPIIGVQSQAAAGTLSGGADAEADDDLRDRLLARYRQPPHGGARFDYEAWALAVAGVTRAWVYPEHLGSGTVGLTFVLDGRADIIPTAQDVAAVQGHVDALRPVTAELVVFAPAPQPLDLSIRLVPDTAANRAAVEAAVDDFVRREAEPGGTIYLSRLREAISQAAGEVRHDLVAPVADIAHAVGTIAVPGAIAWVV